MGKDGKGAGGLEMTSKSTWVHQRGGDMQKNKKELEVAFSKKMMNVETRRW